ncbi:hypothetical protein OG729_05805 [Streptomyces sp. NBC_00210]|uniref:hypothetical protein n=1 Tax=unclassified Streptomyces TaxID=2593676 RepID=UPI0032462D37
MVRFVHKQLAYASVCVVTGLIALAVGIAVNGPVRLPGWWFPLAMLGWGIVWGLLSTTRLLKEGDLPLFRAAVPIADSATVLSAPAQSRRTLLKFYGTMFGFWIVVATVLAAFEPLAAVFNLFWAVDPLMRAERAARWERRRGVLLWQGDVDQEAQPVPAGQPPVFTTPRRRAPNTFWARVGNQARRSATKVRPATVQRSASGTSQPVDRA